MLAWLWFAGCAREICFCGDPPVVVRPPRVDVPVPAVVDRFPVRAVDALDVLWVVDDGPAMAEWLPALADEAAVYLGALAAAGVDARIGVVRSDLAAGGALVDLGGAPFLATGDDPAPLADALRDLALTGPEEPAALGAAYLAVLAAPAELLREDVELYTVVFASADDATPAAALPPGGFAGWYGGLPVQTTLSVVADPFVPTLERTADLLEGDLSAAAGWSEALAARCARHPRTLHLSAIPALDSLTVTLTRPSGEPVSVPRAELLADGSFAAGWAYDADDNEAVLVDFAPLPGEVAEVGYLPAGSLTDEAQVGG